MKKIIFLLFFILFNNSFLFVQEIGERIYKEIEIDGEKVSKWLTYFSFVEFDEKGNTIHRKILIGKEIDEFWYKYNSKNQLIYKKSSTTYDNKTKPNQYWYEYDLNNNLILEKQDNGFFKKFTYDSKNNKIQYQYYKINTYDKSEIIIEQTWYEYDSKGNLIHEIEEYEGLIVSESWYKYDSNNNIIYKKIKKDKIIEETNYEYKYNNTGKILTKTGTDGIIEKYEYDKDDKLIYEKKNYIEFWYEYNSKGKIKYKKNADDNEWFYNYDENDNLISLISTKYSNNLYFYGFFGNGKIKTVKTFRYD